MKRYGRKVIALFLLLTLGICQQAYAVGKEFKPDEIITQTYAIIAKQDQTIEIDSSLIEIGKDFNHKNVKVLVQTGKGYTHDKNKVKVEVEEGTLDVPIIVEGKGGNSRLFNVKIDVVKPRELFFTYAGNMNFKEKSLEGWEASNKDAVAFIPSRLSPYNGQAASITVNGKKVTLESKDAVIKARKGFNYTLNFYGKSDTGRGKVRAGFNKDDGIYTDSIIYLASDSWKKYEADIIYIAKKKEDLGIRFTLEKKGIYDLTRISIIEDFEQPIIHEMKVYYVDNKAPKNGIGSKEKPFNKIKSAVDVLKAGDRCFIREGSYHEEIKLSNMMGSASFPIIIQSYNNEEVVLDGSEAIQPKWKKVKGKENLYKTTLTKDIWQLFKDDKIQTTGRFPNASWEDDSIFKLKKSTRQIKPYESKFGHTVDARPASASHDSEGNYDEGADFGNILPTENKIGLADSGTDYTGSVAVLHMGSWLSWANQVSEHVAGNNWFDYDKKDFSRSGTIMGKTVYRFAGKPGFWKKKNDEHSQGYYFLEGLAAVDTDGEWYYTMKDKTLYVYSSTGKPKGDYRGKTQTYAVDLTNSQYVILNNIDFFGTTIRLNESRYMTLQNSDFMYPSYNKFVLGNYQRPEVTELAADRFNLSYNKVINCKFEYMDGPVLELKGQYNVVDNNYMHHIDYTNLGTGGQGTVNMTDSWYVTFKNNTVHTAGNSEGIRVGKGSKILNNHVYNMSLIQHDGSLINVGAKDDMQKDTVIDGNWSHDSYKASVRFDSANMGNPDTVQYGEFGTISNNVTWNAGPVKVKGNNHKVLNNIAFNPVDSMSIAVLDNPAMGGFNELSVTKNNAGILSSSFGSVVNSLPGSVGNNWDKEPENMVRDYVNWDFRPIKGSKLDQLKIGPYKAEDKNYKIPGYKAKKASMPIPKDGKQGLSTSDLMWLEAYRGTAYNVYFGEGKDKLEYKGQQKNNIYHPDKLELDKKYYWRIDTVSQDGSIGVGELWSFTVKEKAVAEVKKDVEAPVLINTLKNSGFESGLTGWKKAGKIATIHEEKTEKYQGEVSLKVADRGIQGDGVYQDVVLKKGHKYRISAWIKSSLAPQKAYIRTAYKKGAITANIIASGQVDNTMWTQVKGEFEFTEEGPFDFFRLKIDVEGTAAFYVDHVELMDLTPALSRTTSAPKINIKNGNFEEGSKYWGAHGCEIKVDSGVVKEGSQSLFIQKRRNNSTGAWYGLELEKGEKYNVSMSIKLVSGSGKAYYRYVYADKSKKVDAIIKEIGSKEGWKEVKGVIDLESEIGEIGGTAFIKIFVDGTQSDFYIDQVTIEEIK